MKRMFITAILTMLSFSAMADQCQLLDKADAERGAQILSQGTVAYKLCEPCGETTPEKIEITTVEAVDARYQGLYEVLVNGKWVDLAYIYDAQGQNVALQTNCQAQDVSSTIAVQ